jgi:hypothetical protein
MTASFACRCAMASRCEMVARSLSVLRCCSASALRLLAADFGGAWLPARTHQGFSAGPGVEHTTRTCCCPV